MKPYTSYKDSGIVWIGQIPSHWEMRKMKFCFNERVDKNHPQEVKLSATQTHGVIPQTMYEGQGNRVVNVNTGFDTLKLVKVGDFVIHLRSFQGGIEYAYYQGIISPAYTILEPQNPKYAEFYKCLFKSYPYIQLLKTCVTGIREGQNIDYKVLGNKHIPVPPVDEQEAIVRYITEKSEKIDRYVSEQERLLAGLDELRQAEIARAVTRGLNPDVPLRDSGIDWIGSIPAHWSLTTIGRIFNLKAGGDAKPELYSYDKDEEHPFPVYTNSKDKDSVYAYTSTPLYPADAITVAGRGEIGRAFYRNEPFDAIIRLLVLTPKIEFDNKYGAYFIDSVIPFTTDSAAIGQLSTVQISPKNICFPPLDEQRAIVEYLDAKTAKIDRMKADVEKQIGLLKEYKQRMISDAVTGKIDVRD